MEGEAAAAAAREREWEEAAEAVAYDSCTWPPPVVTVCGPGNSGKSAFSRLLLNTLLARFKKVGYLDMDVGQPEFTPPGFVSLLVLEEQAKDFTMLCLRNPKRCFFFGDVCAKKNPELLLTYIFGLYDYFRKEFHRIDDANKDQKSAILLVINTSGWVKGTGLHVLVEMLKYVSPTHVIRVSTIAEGKNLQSGTFWMNEYEGDPPVHLVDIHAACKRSRIIRDLRLVAYFSQVSDLDVHHFLNGTIVGMATSASPLSIKCSTPCCIGLGFIKAVDTTADCIHLITPISDKLLEKVDIIFQSSITVPSCLLQVSDT
ncbi:hypothetical protein ACP4OV_011450 [Aristida adscensionis]